MGAGKWKDDHTAQLKAPGFETVVVIPDNDIAEHAHAEDVTVSSVDTMTAKPAVLPGLPPVREKHGEDVNDLLAMGHTRTDLLAPLDAAATVEPAAAEPWAALRQLAASTRPARA